MDEKDEFDIYMDNLLYGDRAESDNKARILANADVDKPRTLDYGRRSLQDSCDMKDEDARYVHEKRLPPKSYYERHMIEFMTLDKIKPDKDKDKDN